MIAGTALIGRAEELRRLGGLLDGVDSGHAAGLFVVGEAGVGKSRLLEEARAVAGARGFRVAYAACLPLTTALPLEPVLQLLRTLGQASRTKADGSSPEMFWTAVEQLEQATVAGPALLCLDDVQWSDAASLDLIQYSLARLADVPLGWLLAARPGRALERIVHRLGRAGPMERIELRTFSERETEQLAAARLGESELGGELSAVLFERTGGNPFLCLELLRSVAAIGDGGRASAAISELVPASVQHAIEERAGALPENARAALSWAAVLPKPFSFEELEAVAGRGAGTVPEELADTGFLVAEDDGRWCFVHSLIRDVLYGRLPAAERVRRHGVVADAIASGPTERVAPQLELARRPGEAAHAYLRLADSALASGQGEDAMRLYEHAEQLADAADEQRSARAARAGRVLALLRAGRGVEAREAADALRAELRANGELNEQLRFLSGYATTLMIVHEAADIETARDALAEAEPLIVDAAPAERAELLAARAWASLRSGEVASALEDAEAAARLLRPGDPAALQARVLNSLGLVVGIARSGPEGRAVLERAVQRAVEANLPMETSRAYNNLSFLAYQSGDVSGSNAYIQRGVAVEGAPPSMAALLRANLGFNEAQLGNLDTALAHELAAMRIARRAGPLTRARTACALGFVYFWRGELAAVRRLLEEYGLEAGSVIDTRSSELWGLLLEEEGRPAEARAQYAKGTRLEDPVAIRCSLGIARIAAGLGEIDEARAALARIDELVGRWPGKQSTAEETRGWIALGEGRGAEAIARFAAAAAAPAGAYDAARLRLEAARLAHDREQLREAIDAFERMGAARAADRGRALARSLGMRIGRRRPGDGVLSAREQEVAQLVAAGQTNAEIAGTLYLSPRTVERHVGSILAKLGYRSRVQIATEAAAGRLPGAETAAAAKVAEPVGSP